MSRRVGYNAASSPSRSRKSLWDHLLGGEEAILWEGHPGFGFKFNGSALKTLAVVAIGIFILGPQILKANRIGSPMGDMANIPYFGIGHIDGEIFLLVAAVWTVLWFLKQTVTTPFFTHYMLSDRRVFIAKTFLWKRIKSYELSPLRVIEYDGKRNGSIIFASETKRADNGRKREFPVGFVYVNGAEKLYKKMLEVQRRPQNGKP